MKLFSDMKLFSQRKGIKPVKSKIQTDSMDDDLRNGLWSALTIYYWDTMEYKDWVSSDHDMEILFKRLWLNYFKRPLDNLDHQWVSVKSKIRNYFFIWKWYEVYDFIQVVANNYPKEETNQQFMEFCNLILERELSAYRFVGGEITKMTSEEEIAEIEKSLKESPNPVKIHLKTALNFLADRKNPNYRNSIKESISAVESICKLIANNKNATLTLALDTIANGKRVNIHPSLKTAFEKLYGYTNVSDGIRHGLSDEPNLDFEDAKFMLVFCSAFINYLISKSSKAGIKL